MKIVIKYYSTKLYTYMFDIQLSQSANLNKISKILFEQLAIKSAIYLFFDIDFFTCSTTDLIWSPVEMITSNNVEIVYTSTNLHFFLIHLM